MDRKRVAFSLHSNRNGGDKMKLTVSSTTYIIENNYTPPAVEEVDCYGEVKDYYFTDQLEASKISDAITDFIESTLYFNKECLEYYYLDGARINTYALTDSNNNEVTVGSDLYKKFKAGEIKLYCHDIYITLTINDQEVKKEDMELIFSFLKIGG